MRVIWSREAQTQKDAICDFLAERNPAYADRVELRLEARAGSLAALPYLGRSAPDDLRLLSVVDVQYVIVYRIEADVVRIMKLHSTAQGEQR